MYKLIDTHSHIDLPEFEEDIESVIKNLKNNNIEYVVVPSVDRASFKSVLNLCEKYEMLYAALGLHPEEVLKVTDED